MPKLFWSTTEGDQPAYARGTGSSPATQSRAPLDVPPSLRGEVEVPVSDTDVSKSGESSGPVKEAVAGKAVALDAKLYATDAANVFSAVVDAMTALDMPVQSVDSPSGTVTTDWIRQGSKNANSSAIASMFGAGGVQGRRHRFVVRVLRQTTEEKVQTRLEIRTVGQAYMNRHWVNRSMPRKVSGKLFSAVDERLSN